MLVVISKKANNLLLAISSTSSSFKTQLFEMQLVICDLWKGVWFFKPAKKRSRERKSKQRKIAYISKFVHIATGLV